jgi:hypothetical protein
MHHSTEIGQTFYYMVKHSIKISWGVPIEEHLHCGVLLWLQTYDLEYSDYIRQAITLKNWLSSLNLYNIHPLA